MNLVCLIIQAIFSVVQRLAEMMRSPSFSRFSSSITTKNSPELNAVKASSMESNPNLVRFGASRISLGRQGATAGVGVAFSWDGATSDMVIENDVKATGAIFDGELGGCGR
jgi:hypothetical protein